MFQACHVRSQAGSGSWRDPRMWGVNKRSALRRMMGRLNTHAAQCAALISALPMRLTRVEGSSDGDWGERR